MCLPRHEMVFPGNASPVGLNISLCCGTSPKTLTTSANTETLVAKTSRCTMLSLCPSLKTSCLHHPQDGNPPAFCGSLPTFRKRLGAWGVLSSWSPHCTFARRAQLMVQLAARIQVLLTQDRSRIPTCVAVAQTSTWRSQQKRCLRLLGVWSAVLLRCFFLIADIF